MKNVVSWRCVLVLALALAGCNGETTAGSDGAPDLGSPDAPRPRDAGDTASPDGLADLQPPDLVRSGELTLLTYNVAGLPYGLSQSDPDKNTPLISPLLNHFELALMQEDFAYTQKLASKANHPYKSTPGAPQGTILNDGLTLFSDYPFNNLVRHKWSQCNGVFDHANDCLAAKGFCVAELELAPGVRVDLYNLHMDAGGALGDYNARAAQVAQLLAELDTRSKGHPVIIGGDTNLQERQDRNVDDIGLLDTLLKQAQLSDACRALSCGDERIDRVLYRGSASVTLEALSWAVDPRFVDQDGNDLSDHKAVAVKISWRTGSQPVDAGAVLDGAPADGAPEGAPAD
jgi:endonuclease/exonuclease/phosphatase family metal-dependent hydrolase